ncbi:MAG TPA: MraY family glycosyltransferase [Pirellulales bacterium]|nr:MraY family glycosyltransferase [Pirellulales bacterium]
MTAYLVPLLVAAATSLLATPLARRLAWRRGALDHADGQRKLHASPVPYWGGLALFTALAVGTISGAALHSWGGLPRPSPANDGLGRPPHVEISQVPLALLASASMMCLVGWLDDRNSLRVRWKLLGQVLATFPLVFSGHGIERIECGGFVLDPGWWSVPLTIAWLVACANAVNFLDGADGLAASLGLVIAAAATLVADRLEHTDAAMLGAVLAGSLAGFIFYNWQPATIYLGDAGSMTVGLWLAAVAAEGSREPPLGSRMVVLVALLAVPAADVALAIARRLLSGKRFWLPDRAHLHHRLMDGGRTVPQVVAALAGIAAVTGLVAFLAAVHGRELLAWASLALVAIAVVRFDLAGRRELELVCEVAARSMLRLLTITASGSGPSAGGRQSELGRLPLPSAWAMFLADMQAFQVELVEMTIAGLAHGPPQTWQVALAPCDVADLWSVEVDFRGAGGESCRLRVGVRDGAATAPLHWLALQDRLRMYATHWARHAAALGAALGTGPRRGLTIVPAPGDDLAKAA